MSDTVDPQGATPPKEPVVLAHCPRCDGDRRCDMLGEAVRPWSWEDERNSMQGSDTHRLLECRGCTTVFYWKSSWDDQDADHIQLPNGEWRQIAVDRVETYPTPEKKSQKPDWVWSLHKQDPQLHQILEEIYGAVERGSNILAATGLRTAFDRTVSLHAIDESLSLREKVKALQKQGFIGQTEADNLQTVVDAGSAAAHRGWNPSEGDLRELLLALEQFIYRTVIVGKGAQSVSATIPKRDRKNAAAKPAAEV